MKAGDARRGLAEEALCLLGEAAEAINELREYLQTEGPSNYNGDQAVWELTTAASGVEIAAVTVNKYTA